MSKNIAIIFAGGSGARMGTGLPKQFLEVNGKPIIIHTLDIFEEHPLIDEIYIACKSEYIGHDLSHQMFGSSSLDNGDCIGGKQTASKLPKAKHDKENDVNTERPYR